MWLALARCYDSHHNDWRSRTSVWKVGRLSKCVPAACARLFVWPLAPIAWIDPSGTREALIKCARKRLFFLVAHSRFTDPARAPDDASSRDQVSALGRTRAECHPAEKGTCAIHRSSRQQLIRADANVLPNRYALSMCAAADISISPAAFNLVQLLAVCFLCKWLFISERPDVIILACV
jgi:hypothetical protein